MSLAQLDSAGAVPEPLRQASPQRIAFLSNSWLEGDEWGPFQRSLIDLFGAAAEAVLVLRANSFFEPWTDTPRSGLHLRRFLHVLENFAPTLIFTINRAGMSGPVVRSLPPETRVVSLFIDYYDRVPDALKQWTGRDFVWGTGTGWLRDNFVHKYRSELRPDQIEFTLWGSDTHRFHPSADVERDIDLLFIASPLSPEPMADTIEFLAREHADLLATYLDVYFDHRQRYVHDIPAELARRGFDTSRITTLPYRTYFDNNWILQAFMSDQISCEARLKYLSALADFDLHLYGEPEALWIRFISTVDANLLRRYRYRPVKDIAELPSLYARAKVGLNVQHHHAHDVGLSMRVFDTMASGALLLTHRIAAAPLAELGYHEDEHFVAFDGVDECREKTRWVLEDDVARQRISTAGCVLTHEHHSLQQRLATVFASAGFRDLARDLNQLTPDAVAAAETDITYVSNPDAIDLPAHARQPFPRTFRELRLMVGQKLPHPLLDLDRRMFGSWFFTVRVKHDPERRKRNRR